MSLISKLRKKRNQPSPAPTRPPASIKDEEDVYVPPKSPEPEPNLPSPTHAVEIPSIFTGLKLSAEVASIEGGESPYMQRVTERSEVSEDTPSSFSFLKQEVGVASDRERSPPIEASPFDFIEEEDQPSTFSFLNSPSESHDGMSESHDGMSKSHDLPSESRDGMFESHSVHTGVSDVNAESDDLPTQSFEAVTKSHDLINVSHDSEVEPRKLSYPIVDTSSLSVTKRHAPVGGRKKKKKAVRPGHSVQEEPSDLDTLSVSSHTSSLEGTHTDTVDEKTTPLSTTVDHEIEVLNEKESANQNEESHSHDQTAELVHVSPSESQTELVADSEQLSDDHITMVTKEQIEPVPTDVTDDAMTTKEPDNPVLEDNGDLSAVFTSPNYEVELSASDRLTALLESYQNGLDGIRSSLSVSTEGVCAAVDEQLSCAQSQVNRRKLVAELKSQQLAALNEEDYEQAEQINSKLDETVLTKEWMIADSCLQAVSEWIVKCCEADESEVKFREDMQTKVLSLQEEQSRALVDLDKQHSSLLAKDKLKIQAMEDKLEREKGHLSLDQEHLERSEQVLREEVQRRAAEFISKKEALQEELTSVQSEISLLEAKLSALHQQRKVISTNILEQENEISHIEKELATERAQVEIEREGIQARSTQLDKEQERIANEKSRVESVHDELMFSRQGLAELIERARTVSEDFDKRVNGLKLYKQEVDHLEGMLEEGRKLLAPSNKLASLLESCTCKSSEVDVCTADMLSVQSELSRLRKEAASLEGQIPQLKDSKKAAVTGRQFKEASRIAGELKTVSANLEEVKGQISSADVRLSSLNKQLTKLSEELEVVKNETDTLEKEEDERHLSELLANSDLLQEISGRLEGSALQGVVNYWIELYGLLADNLATKHCVQLADYQHSKGEGYVGVASPSSPKEERTPGVGKEEEPVNATPTVNNDQFIELEREIEAACSVEDYDRAAELEEKLQMLKQCT